MKESERIKKATTASTKKKGFYYAVFASVAVMLAIAAVVGYRNLNPSEPNSVAVATPKPWENYPAAGVNASEDDPLESYLTPEDRLNSPSISEAGTEIITPPIDDIETYLGEGIVPIVPTEEDELARRTPKPEETPKIEATPAPSIVPEPTAQPVTPPAKISESSETQDESFTAYDGNSKMEWPIFGELVMDYSMEHLVYDKTLEQYRTNSSICIAAEIGTQVKASADGKVNDVFTSRENGKAVTIDHGNGWTTTYSQLQDNVLVQVGDVVKTGQVIGGVGNPSIYSLMLGNHLAFSVTNEDGFINPHDLLAQ